MDIKTILIDDEILNLKNLEIILKENFSEIEVLGSFQSVATAKLFLDANQIDLVFLDISMPIENGFDLLNHYPNRNFSTIFVTAHEEFAIKALRTGATDYILKPILNSELATAINRVKSAITPSINTKSNKITLNYEGGKSIVNTQEILYIKGIDNLAIVYQTKNRKVMVSKTLKHFEDSLHKDFFRIHKSFLVNLTYASKILSRQATFLELLDGTKLPISRRNYKSLQSALSVC